jgi:hypothetical protein
MIYHIFFDNILMFSFPWGHYANYDVPDQKMLHHTKVT